MRSLKKTVLILLGVVLASNFAAAQNYKAPKIDASGKITNGSGKQIGSLNTNGEIMDSTGTKIAYIDANGTLVDARNGKKLGKVEKNGNYTSYFTKTPDKGWTTSSPANGTCQVKDEKGNIKAEVHENYKQFGACAIHCLENNMKHGEVLDKSKSKKSPASYTCSMHPEVVSDKPGKCSKCGMKLIKK
jgi:hypothetical protein